MTEEVAPYSALVSLNKAAGDGLRCEILRVLSHDAFGVLELCQIFDYRQSGMSHHLKVLAEAGLVAKRREGNSIFYSRALLNQDSPLALFQQQLNQTIDSADLRDDVSARVQSVKAERASLSQQFFSQKADGFKEQQDLIAEFAVYGDAVDHLLTRTALPSLGNALEIGPGAGDFLPALARKFNAVVALDNSAAMLKQANALCDQQQLSNVDFVCRDTAFLVESSNRYDCVVMNMVLHHTPSPAAIFNDITAGLKKGGVFILTELCRHDQDWARNACGDLWLGFDADELQQWAAAAGLNNGHSHYIALRNGFQIQCQQFVKI